MSNNQHSDNDLNGTATVVESAARAVRSVKSGAAHVAHEARAAAGEVGETLGETWDDIASDVQEIVGQTRESGAEWVRRHPFGAVAAAAATGWVLARLFSRR